MASPIIIPRELVAEHLAVSTRLLLALEARGLVRVSTDDGIEGYEPIEIRRLWSIVTLQRDCGVNLAGIEAILTMRARIDELHQRVDLLARTLHEVLEAELGSASDSGSNSNHS